MSGQSEGGNDTFTGGPLAPRPRSTVTLAAICPTTAEAATTHCTVAGNAPPGGLINTFYGDAGGNDVGHAHGGDDRFIASGTNGYFPPFSSGTRAATCPVLLTVAMTSPYCQRSTGSPIPANN